MKNCFLLSKNPSKPFIVLFDKFFEKIGEVILPEKKYNTNIVFVFDGKFFIAKSNFWDRTIGEDQLIFQELIFSK